MDQNTFTLVSQITTLVLLIISEILPFTNSPAGGILKAVSNSVQLFFDKQPTPPVVTNSEPPISEEPKVIKV